VVHEAPHLRPTEMPQRLAQIASSNDCGLKELYRRNAELMEGIAARDTFIAVAAHELPNPMTTIMGQVDLLMAAVQTGHYFAAFPICAADMPSGSPAMGSPSTRELRRCWPDPQGPTRAGLKRCRAAWNASTPCWAAACPRLPRRWS